MSSSIEKMALAALLLLIFSSSAALAEPAYVIDSYPRIANIYVGQLVVTPGMQPLTLQAQPQTTVSADEVVYTAPGERYVFWSWSDVVRELRRELGSVSQLTAVYRRQVYVNVLYANGSGWYFTGETAKLSVDRETIYKGKGERLVFQGWEGVPLPDRTEVQLTVSEPVTVKAVWRREYLLEVEAEGQVVGGGWYPEGYRAVVHAKPLTYTAEGERLRLLSIEPQTPAYTTCLNMDCSPIAVEVSGPTLLKASYARECRVTVSTPEQYSEQWVECGAQTVLKTSNYIPVSEDTRLRFVEWVVDGERYRDPVAVIPVDKPRIATAKYATEYLVRVVTPFGNSAEWAEAGSLKTLYPPQASTTYILASYVFKQWRNYGREPSLTIRVEKPTTIVAEYTLQPDYTSLTILAAAVTAIALASLATRRRT